MVGLRQKTAFHHDVDENGMPLSIAERERLLEPFLPAAPENKSKSTAQQGQKRRRTKGHSSWQFLKAPLHVLIFNIVQLIFGVYIRVRRAYRNIMTRIIGVFFHHHRTPELIQRDVRDLGKLPKHLSMVLELDGNLQDGFELEQLVNNVCECAAWTACAGIPTLSIYEKTGVLKASLPRLHRKISSTMSSYFGADSPAKPTISLRAPLMPAFSPPTPTPDPSGHSRPHLSILILSATDGRGTLVDLTKTLAEMSQKHKLGPEDISTELIDAEISESVMQEPDLLILFAESVVLQGFPPWQLRLTEIFHVPDNTGVGYQVFLQGLQNYSHAQMRFGS